MVAFGVKVVRTSDGRTKGIRGSRKLTEEIKYFDSSGALKDSQVIELIANRFHD